jgi:hypothetical protein
METVGDVERFELVGLIFAISQDHRVLYRSCILI